MTGLSAPLGGVTGIVLAGGRSARFGSDKLAAVLDGRPLLQRAVEAVAVVAEPVIIVAAPGAEPAIPAALTSRIRVVHDPEAFGGPLVGLGAALTAVETATAVVVGADMPHLVPAVLRRLALAVGPGQAAVNLEVPGRVQPLPMALDVVAARAATAAVLGRGGLALRDLLRELRATAIPAPAWLALDPAGATITDIDRPSDLTT